MKICVYTCITGNYDSLKPFGQQSQNVDFICFTDNQNLIYNSNNWEIRKIPHELDGLTNVKKQRAIKILSHKFLPEYDITLWIDGNIKITCDILKFINGFDFEKFSFYTRKHPSRKCAYKEAESVLDFGKDNFKTVNLQMEKYKKDGFPRDFGLEETGIILRNNVNKKCQLLCNMWVKEIMENSHRDQLSLDYCIWKSKVEIGYIDIPSLKSNKYFKWVNHG